MMIFNSRSPDLLVVDGFLKDPDAVRELALQQQFVAHNEYHKGKRTEKAFLMPYVREEFERLLQRRIPNWMQHETNGVFQVCNASDPLVYHSDSQDYAAAIYLTPDAPLNSGTSFYRSKRTGLTASPTDADAMRAGMSKHELCKLTYDGNLLDSAAWDLVDSVGNRYNRLVIWNAQRIHSASGYFGPDDPAQCRLFQLFFFDVE